MTSPPPLFRSPDWEQLRDSLPATPVVDKLLEPLHLLERLYAHAEGALRSYALDVVRMRMILRALLPWARVGDALLKDKLASSVALVAPSSDTNFVATAIADTTDSAAPDVGLLRAAGIGWLLVAAGRCGEDEKEVPLFVRTVIGLVLAVGPLDALARLEPFGPGTGNLDRYLEEIARAVEGTTGRAVFERLLPMMLVDPAERRRWALVRGVGLQMEKALHADRAFEAGRSRWDAAWSDTVEKMEVTREEVAVRFAEREKFDHAKGELWGEAQTWEQAAEAARQADPDTVARYARWTEPAPGGVWGGLSSDAASDASTDWRTTVVIAVQKALPSVLANEIVAGVPRDDDVLRCPPIGPRNRGMVAQDRKLVVDAPTEGRPGESFAVHWRLEPEPPAGARVWLEQKLDGKTLDRRIVESSPVTVQVDRPGDLALVFRGAGASSEAVVRIAALRRTLVVLRPRIGTGVSSLDRAAAGSVGERAKARGVDLHVLEPAFVPDELAWLAAMPEPGSLALESLHDEIDRWSLHCPGGEDATWMVLLPTPVEGAIDAAPRGVLSERAGQVVRRQVIATADRLDEAFDRLARQKDGAPWPTVPCLRFEARLAKRGLDVIHTRFEMRRVSPRGKAGPFHLVTVDAKGVERSRTALPRPSVGGAIRALVPVPADAAAVLIRRQDKTLGRAVRPTPGAVETTADNGVIAWTWTGPAARKAVPLVEGSLDDVLWGPVCAFDSCAEQFAMPKGRIPAETRRRLVLHDGFNGVEAALKPEGASPRLILRRADTGRWWADTDGSPDDALSWWMDGEQISKGRTCDTGRRIGVLQLELLDEGGEVIATDARWTGETAPVAHTTWLPERAR